MKRTASQVQLERPAPQHHSWCNTPHRSLACVHTSFCLNCKKDMGAAARYEIPPPAFWCYNCTQDYLRSIHDHKDYFTFEGVWVRRLGSELKAAGDVWLFRFVLSSLLPQPIWEEIEPEILFE